MTAPHNPHNHPWNDMPWDGDAASLLLERYIDGDLEGDELAQMEVRLLADPALRAQIDLQSRIDSSLKRTHDALTIPMPAIPIDLARELAGSPAISDRADIAPTPTTTATPTPTPTTSATDDDYAPVPIRFPLKRWVTYAAAAAILLAAAGLFRAYWDARVPDFRLMEPIAMYDKLVATGFQPAVICKTEPEFARLVKEKLGIALIASATPGIEILGWGYQDDYDGSPISPKTMMLLTRVEGREVLILLDHASRDRTLKAPPGSNKAIFRREVGPLITYEITPFAEPRVLPTLREP